MKKKLGVSALVAATYFMVAGGPYGLEDLIKFSGYKMAVFILLVTPLIWSLPTALMVAELGSAIPEEGGYYVWVKRAMGPFWGFQEAWLSLVASIFDMAIYPTLFGIYLARLLPKFGVGNVPLAVGLFVIASCVALNLRGAGAVGKSSLLFTVVLLGPFVVFAVMCILHGHANPHPAPLTRTDILGGVLIAMWNYMGWDNASTIAGEVENPKRTYPRAMMIAVALVALTYIVPVALAGKTGFAPDVWETGAWVAAGAHMAGSWLGAAIVLGGMVSAFGIFNSLVLSYSRIPVALAEDKRLPKIFLKRNSAGAPYVAVIVCAIAWALCLKIGFERLVALDVVLYGLSLLLEFVALVMLRLKSPELERPFRIPFGTFGAVAAGLGPLALIALALWHERSEMAGPIPAVALGAGLIALGFIAYFVSTLQKKTA